jgi:hypothetical protein
VLAGISIPKGECDEQISYFLTNRRFAHRSLIEKAADAAKRYIGRYTGGEFDPDALQSVEVSLELVCPKQKRVIPLFKGLADGPLSEPPLTGEPITTIVGGNHERVAVGYAKAHAAAAPFLRAKPNPCD